MKRIHMISGPRNLSTAIMYSFGSRQDCSCVDEPFYASYLHSKNIDHPGKEDILKSQNTNPLVVIKDVINADYNTPLLFIKNMAHHLFFDELKFLNKTQNFFLVRDPHDLICSFAQVIPNPTIDDIGIKKEFELFSYLSSFSEPFVLDSGDLIKDPETILNRLCTSLGIPFSRDMLQWKKGPKSYDGIWWPYWYSNVHKSEGFSIQRQKRRKLPKHLNGLYEEAMSYYVQLSNYRIKAH